VPSPTVQRSTIPPDLESVLMTSLAKVPADRYRTASDFAVAIKAVRLGETVSGVGSGRFGPAGHRSRVLTGAAVTFLIIVGVALGRDGFGALSGWLSLGGAGTQSGGRGVVSGALPPDRIAVRYFEDLSQDASLGFVADGLTESLIDELALVPALDVLSRDGAERFRDPAVPVDSLARVVRAGTVVSGTVRRSGEGLQLSVALADGESGAEFQRGTFDVSEADLLAGRAELVAEVARLLREWLGEEITLRGVRGGTESVAAWALFQRAERERKEAEGSLDEGDIEGFIEGFTRSDSLLAEAEQEDEAWARPPNLRARLALTWTQLLADEPLEAQAWIEEGMAHVDRVLDLEPTNANALETRGILKYLVWALSLEPDPVAAGALLPSAEEDLRASVRSDPSRANAWNVLSIVHSEKPDLIEAKIAAQRAYEADSFLRSAEDVLAALYATSYDLEQFPDAVQYCGEGGRRFPANQFFVECELWLLSSPALGPDVERAWILAAEFEELSPPPTRDYDASRARILVGGVLARAAVVDSSDLGVALGDSADAVFEAARPGPDIDPSQELLGIEAIFRLQMGQDEEALRLLRIYLTASPEHRASWRFSSHWWWRGLQENQGFSELVGGD
jgi:serine/threonine-protein kinase